MKLVACCNSYAESAGSWRNAGGAATDETGGRPAYEDPDSYEQVLPIGATVYVPEAAVTV